MQYVVIQWCKFGGKIFTTINCVNTQMNHMRAAGIAKVVPRLDPKDGVEESNFRGGHFNGGLTSNYFTRQACL